MVSFVKSFSSATAAVGKLQQDAIHARFAENADKSLRQLEMDGKLVTQKDNKVVVNEMADHFMNILRVNNSRITAKRWNMKIQAKAQNMSTALMEQAKTLNMSTALMESKQETEIKDAKLTVTQLVDQLKQELNLRLLCDYMDNDMDCSHYESIEELLEAITKSTEHDPQLQTQLLAIVNAKRLAHWVNDKAGAMAHDHYCYTEPSKALEVYISDAKTSGGYINWIKAKLINQIQMLQNENKNASDDLKQLNENLKKTIKMKMKQDDLKQLNENLKKTIKMKMKQDDEEQDDEEQAEELKNKMMQYTKLFCIVYFKQYLFDDLEHYKFNVKDYVGLIKKEDHEDVINFEFDCLMEAANDDLIKISPLQNLYQSEMEQQKKAEEEKQKADEAKQEAEAAKDSDVLERKYSFE